KEGKVIRTFVGAPDFLGKPGAAPRWETSTLVGHLGGLRSVAWSSDGARILSCSADKTVKVWDATTAKALLAFSGHLGEVRSVAWDRDERRVLSCSLDKTLKVWDAAT